MKYHLLERKQDIQAKESISSPISDTSSPVQPKHIVSNEVGGLDTALNSLREIVILPLLYREEIEYLRIDVPRGIYPFSPKQINNQEYYLKDLQELVKH